VGTPSNHDGDVGHARTSAQDGLESGPVDGEAPELDTIGHRADQLDAAVGEEPGSLGGVVEAGLGSRQPPSPHVEHTRDLYGNR